MEWVGAGLIGICATNRPTACVDVFTEAFAYESHKLIRPAYYDIMLDQKIAQDENSKKMLDLMFDSITYDVGYNYEPSRTCGYLLKAMVIERRNQSSASYLKKIDDKMKTIMEEMVESLYNR